MCTCATEALAIGRALERGEHLRERPAVDAFQQRDACSGGKGGTWSCSFASSSAMSGGQQIAPRREHLSELHEDRSERFERAPQSHRARLVEHAPEEQRR